LNENDEKTFSSFFSIEHSAAILQASSSADNDVICESCESYLARNRMRKSLIEMRKRKSGAVDEKAVSCVSCVVGKLN
jgi:hypothetical protein